MIHPKLLNPSNIVIVGASNNIHKPGGKILKNLLENEYKGELLVVNPKEDEIQGIKSFKNVSEIPSTDVAILAIPAAACLEVVKDLADNKGTKGFIIISAGFSEEGTEGAEIERQIAQKIENVGGSLIGPNCIGLITPAYAGVFTTPVPTLDAKGVDFVSGSGATAVFIMESGIPKGLHFASVFSVGNSAQIGIEEVLEFWDDTYSPETSSSVKLLYVEHIHTPDKLLKHASSLIRKGCKIAAIKAGSTEAGSRAATSHTGA
ncbi:MAG: CoA-binding protein, partial [Bacteroidota bacterium]|nr:CoA-binding protein [Bacteroidota bacterium]